VIRAHFVDHSGLASTVGSPRLIGVELPSVLTPFGYVVKAINAPVVRTEVIALSGRVEDISRTATPFSTASVAMIGAARIEAVTALGPRRRLGDSSACLSPPPDRDTPN
jgi:hypothetical protein